MPAVDVLKDFAERRCHKPDDESAVYPAALLSLSEKSSFVHDHFIYFPDTVLQRIYPIVGTVDLGAGLFQ